MNRRTLIALVSIAGVLILGIVVGVLVLYHGATEKTVSPDSVDMENFPVLQAVPSDAAAVLCVDGLKKGMALFADETKAFSALVSDRYIRFFQSLDDGIKEGSLASLRSTPMSVSLHYSGSIVPMVEIYVPMADGTAYSQQVVDIRTAAENEGLSAGFRESENYGIVLVSSSETLVNTSLRHQNDGASIIAGKDFAHAVKAASGKNVFFISNAYSTKLLQFFFTRQVSKSGSFFKNLSAWTVLNIDSCDNDKFVAKGSFAYGSGGDWFAKTMASQQPSAPSFQKIVPSETVFCVSIPLNNNQSYISAYRRYLDDISELGGLMARSAELKKAAGVDPSDWAKAVAVSEVSKAVWKTDSGLRQALLVRIDKKLGDLREMSLQPYKYSGFASVLFGKLFSVPEETHCFYTGEWIVSGSESDIADFEGRFNADDQLQALLSDASVSASLLGRPSTFVAYFAAGAYPSEDVFSDRMMESVNSTLAGTSLEPCILTCSGRSFQLEVSRVANYSKVNVPAISEELSIGIPSGPFKVMNSGTGKTNDFYQSSNNSLTLSEEGGKALWSIPFSEPICGAVETVDFYANGKLQFLFAAGTKLYLIDRLGRFVTGFPVDLGKEVLLGPKVCEFSGVEGSAALILHKDNSLALYDLKGQPVEGWKGLSAAGQIIALPEILQLGETKYWIVRNYEQTLIFPYGGGDPIVSQTGAKSIRRDAEIVPAEKNTVKAVCNDGKTRTFKLQ